MDSTLQNQRQYQKQRFSCFIFFYFAMYNFMFTLLFLLISHTDLFEIF